MPFHDTVPFDDTVPFHDTVPIWLTGPMATPARAADLETLEPDLITDKEAETQTGDPTVAHIVKTKRGENAAAKVLEARIAGTPLEALCGHVWVPSRDPRQLPVCQRCREIYDMYRGFNDRLDETPND